MVAAIAAGCTVMLKPSELAPASQELMVEIIPKYLDSSAIRVITAGPDEMSYLLEHKFNHILYTGSAAVAKIISRAACRFLTPVVLEPGEQGVQL
jgi:aldehyde dehydrogenase (NAD+)